MERNSNPLPGDPAVQSFSPRGELIIRDGRLSGTRRPLTAPITTIGRAKGCDLRLQAKAIHSYHGVLAFTSTGLVFRNLQADGGTLVNGQAVTRCTLREGDLLSIGPYQFQVHLPGEDAAVNNRALEPERQALRIQAAAVAAQQAALTEEEMRLQHRREALEQQEQQLATHLEEKRRRLVTLRDEAREARAGLEQVRADYEQRVAQITNDLAQSQRELADSQSQAQTERQHLLDLRRRLKHRFHRHWSSERRAMRLREAELAKQRHDLEKESQRLQREKAGLMQARMGLNGEMELANRRLRVDAEQLEKEQTELRERTRALAQREVVLTQGERELADEKRYWQQARFQLYQEAEGLEGRILSLRGKLLEQEQELHRLQSARNPTARGKSSVAFAAFDPRNDPRSSAVLGLGAWWQQREQELQTAQTEVRNRLAALQRVAGELADQRLYLTEQCERLVQVQQQWQRDHDSIAAELESVGRRLRKREEALQIREETVEAAEGELHQRTVEIARSQKHLESSSARLAASTATWEGERDRLLESVRAREAMVEQRLAALNAVRERWGRCRQRQLCRWRARREACETLRREAESLRQECVRRSTLLAEEQRALAGRALALEQYRQRWIARAVHPKAAEKRLERLRRRWAALTVSAERTLAKERKYLEMRATCLEEATRQHQQGVSEFTAQEAELSKRQADWDQQQLRDQAEQDRMRRDLVSLRNQRHSYEQQLDALREEVERLARLLLDDTDPAPLRAVQAA